MKLLDESSLIYQVQSLPQKAIDSITASRGKEVLHIGWYIDTTDQGWSLVGYSLSDSATRLLTKGEEHYAAGRYTEAIDAYRQTMKLEPKYTQALTFVGDAFYSQNRFDSAIYYFRQEITKNFIDYQAHWFLGDALWHVDDTDGAIQELTIAHVLNRNHEDIANRLNKYRLLAGRQWRDWSYSPLYALSKSGDTVFVNTEPKWLGYALAKAIWKYEPGYAESMGTTDTLLFNATEEKEALLMSMSSFDSTISLNSIVSDGLALAFLYYELAAVRYPGSVWLLPGELIESMVQYVDKYH